MKLNIIKSYTESLKSQCVILGLYENTLFSKELEELDKLSDGQISKVIELENLTGKKDTITTMYSIAGTEIDRAIIVGLGNKEEGLSLKEYISLINKVWKQVIALNISSVDFMLNVNIKDHKAGNNIKFAIQGLNEAVYIFDDFKTEKTTIKLTSVNFLSTADNINNLVAEAQAISSGIKIAKDLGNTPCNVCVPSYFAEFAATYEKNPNTTVKIINEAKMKELGMEAYLAVSQGSIHEAFLSVIEYTNAPDKSVQPIVLVGKGLTFDTGGISLKPGLGMDEMKYDMCGGATVFGVMDAIAKLNLPIHVVGMVAGCENAIGSKAYKPGDIIGSMNGKTIEVLNTDAEGRLVLVDSLEYAKTYNPSLIIDMATLTGACLIALGHHLSAVYSNRDSIATSLVKSGLKTEDKAWHMPLAQEFADQLKSSCADIANIGGRMGGSVTAAEFLHTFVGDDYSWAHLDIAGTAWNSGEHKGGTGRPVALLTQFLIDHK
ncbi:MAG: leucyl aminopeptidase [Psittacicella sp.]